MEMIKSCDVDLIIVKIKKRKSEGKISGLEALGGTDRRRRKKLIYGTIWKRGCAYDFEK